jgi:hypothetical protein
VLSLKIEGVLVLFKNSLGEVSVICPYFFLIDFVIQPNFIDFLI